MAPITTVRSGDRVDLGAISRTIDDRSVLGTGVHIAQNERTVDAVHAFVDHDIDALVTGELPSTPKRTNLVASTFQRRERGVGPAGPVIVAVRRDVNRIPTRR